MYLAPHIRRTTPPFPAPENAYIEKFYHKRYRMIRQVVDKNHAKDTIVFTTVDGEGRR
jgi:hypothetical protein